MLADFTGPWQLARTIAHADGLTAALTGTATFTPEGRGLAYAETGALSIAGAPPFEATQRYTWDERLGVHFADGRFFHTVPAQGGPASHWCDPDQYDGVYDFSDWPRWTLRWQVRGPRKDYTSDTTYWR
ncbi:MAG: DUF6314 family protein [Pseudomonadota bacterium]